MNVTCPVVITETCSNFSVGGNYNLFPLTLLHKHGITQPYSTAVHTVTLFIHILGTHLLSFVKIVTPYKSVT
jgi:hypothetical protein